MRHHHRCYRNKATQKYLVLGRDGIELIDLATGEGVGHAWVRGACQYGVMPCNGLIYAPPHSCACHVESMLNGFKVLAPAGKTIDPPSDAPRLVRGPAYDTINADNNDDSSQSVTADDWPTLRHDPARSGRSSTVVPVGLRRAWNVKLPSGSESHGKFSAPVLADGRLFVARIDTHTVHALDARNGALLWSFTAGGRVDSPPTIHRGTAIFGSADGWIYCLRAADGKLAWRFRAAADDRCIVSYGQIESAWPVHGSVLVEDNVVYAVAGRTPQLDGGLTLYRLDARSGKQLSQTPVNGNALPDVLSSDGTSVYLRHRRFNREGVEQTGAVPHLYSPAGFLDGSWWHRTYWMFGTSMRSGWGSWPNSGMQVPAGRILVLDGSTVYGFGRFNQYHRNGSHVGLGNMEYLLYASERSTGDAASGQAQRRGAKPSAGPNVPLRWTESLSVLARGMLLSDQTLFIAGPPDGFVQPPDGIEHPYHVTSIEALREQDAALTGHRGGALLAVSSDDGKTLARYELEAPPVFDGLIAAAGRLFLTTTDGQIVCFEGK